MRFRCNSIRVLSSALFILVLLVNSMVAVAQPLKRPCAEETAPTDGFQSPGVGLTRPELEAIYGPGEAGQGSIVYDFHGLNLHKVGCDLILDFPLGWTAGTPMDEVALAEALLPSDAENAGSFARGTSIRDEPPVSLWRSASLAARFAFMNGQRWKHISQCPRPRGTR